MFVFENEHSAKIIHCIIIVALTMSNPSRIMSQWIGSNPNYIISYHQTVQFPSRENM